MRSGHKVYLAIRIKAEVMQLYILLGPRSVHCWRSRSLLSLTRFFLFSCFCLTGWLLVSTCCGSCLRAVCHFNVHIMCFAGRLNNLNDSCLRLHPRVTSRNARARAVVRKSCKLRPCRQALHVAWSAKERSNIPCDNLCTHRICSRFSLRTGTTAIAVFIPFPVPFTTLCI